MKKSQNFSDKCRCCFDFLSPKKDKLVYKWPLCSVVIPIKPSVDRKSGGHLILFPHRHVIKLSDLEPKEALAVMRASMIIERAMYEILPSLGIDLVNINIQDNGNLNVDEPENRHFHLHFYGRVRDNKNFSHREFLCLPLRESDYYRNLISFDKRDKEILANRIKELEASQKFDFNDRDLSEKIKTWRN